MSMPTPEDEVLDAFAQMYPAVRAAKRQAHTEGAKTMDYMVKIAERVKAEAQKRDYDMYYSSFATELADMVGKLVTRWTT